jgi:hypothetical protein
MVMEGKKEMREGQRVAVPKLELISFRAPLSAHVPGGLGDELGFFSSSFVCSEAQSDLYETSLAKSLARRGPPCV